MYHYDLRLIQECNKFAYAIPIKVAKALKIRNGNQVKSLWSYASTYQYTIMACYMF
jgi:hypothetical protein